MSMLSTLIDQSWHPSSRQWTIWMEVVEREVLMTMTKPGPEKMIIVRSNSR